MLTNTYNALNRMVGEIGEWKQDIAVGNADTEYLNNVAERLQGFASELHKAHRKDQVRPLEDISSDLYTVVDTLSTDELKEIYEGYTGDSFSDDIDGCFRSVDDFIETALSCGFDLDEWRDANFYVVPFMGEPEPFTELQFRELFLDTTLDLILKDREFDYLRDFRGVLNDLLDEYEKALSMQ